MTPCRDTTLPGGAVAGQQPGPDSRRSVGGEDTPAEEHLAVRSVATTTSRNLPRARRWVACSAAPDLVMGARDMCFSRRRAHTSAVLREEDFIRRSIRRRPRSKDALAASGSSPNVASKLAAIS